MHAIDCHFRKKALTGPDNECGDTGIIQIRDNICFLALIDALGHGSEAYDVAVMAENFLTRHADQDLVSMMKGLHNHLKGSRGAVAAVGRLDLESGILTYAGIGNICLKRHGTRPKRLVIKDGVLGYTISTPVENRLTLLPGDIFIMTSDGIREHIDMDQFPDLFMGSAADITSRLIEEQGKKNDDASCIVLRYGI